MDRVHIARGLELPRPNDLDMCGYAEATDQMQELLASSAAISSGDGPGAGADLSMPVSG